MSLIQVQNLSKSFGKHRVLKDLNVNFEEGKIITVLGPNASGKTTLIKCILGMVIPDEGQVMIRNEDIAGKWEFKKDINYLPQIAQFPENLKVNELMDFIEKLRGRADRKNRLIEVFGLEEHLNEKVSVLSGGTKQKVNLVLAFMYDNPIYILDEPTNGLDPVALIHLKELIDNEKKKGKCIIITTHIMQLVEELADEIIYLLEGHVHFKGSVSELKEVYAQNNVEKAIAAMIRGENSKNLSHVENRKV